MNRFFIRLNGESLRGIMMIKEDWVFVSMTGTEDMISNEI